VSPCLRLPPRCHICTTGQSRPRCTPRYRRHSPTLPRTHYPPHHRRRCRCHHTRRRRGCCRAVRKSRRCRVFAHPRADARGVALIVPRDLQALNGTPEPLQREARLSVEDERALHPARTVILLGHVHSLSAHTRRRGVGSDMVSQRTGGACALVMCTRHDLRDTRALRYELYEHKRDVASRRSNIPRLDKALHMASKNIWFSP